MDTACVDVNNNESGRVGLRLARAEMDLTAELKRLNMSNRPPTPGAPLKRSGKITNFASKINFDEMVLGVDSATDANGNTEPLLATLTSKQRSPSSIMQNLESMPPTAFIMASHHHAKSRSRTKWSTDSYTEKSMLDPVFQLVRSEGHTHSHSKGTLKPYWDKDMEGMPSLSDKSKGDGALRSLPTTTVPGKSGLESLRTAIKAIGDSSMRTGTLKTTETPDFRVTATDPDAADASTRNQSVDQDYDSYYGSVAFSTTDEDNTYMSKSMVENSYVPTGDDPNAKVSGVQESGNEKTHEKTSPSGTGTSKSASTSSNSGSKTGSNKSSKSSGSGSSGSDKGSGSSTGSYSKSQKSSNAPEQEQDDVVEVDPDCEGKKGAIMFKVPGRLTHKTTIKVSHFPQNGTGFNVGNMQEQTFSNCGPGDPRSAAMQQQMMAYQQYCGRGMYCMPYGCYPYSC